MAMKRLQIMIEPELDRALAREARRGGTSKGALIRQFVRERLKPLPPIEEDAIWDIVGMGEGAPDSSLTVDDIVYPRNGPT